MRSMISRLSESSRLLRAVLLLGVIAFSFASAATTEPNETETTVETTTTQVIDTMQGSTEITTSQAEDTSALEDHVTGTVTSEEATSTTEGQSEEQGSIGGQVTEGTTTTTSEEATSTTEGQSEEQGNIGGQVTEGTTTTTSEEATSTTKGQSEEQGNVEGQVTEGTTTTTSPETTDTRDAGLGNATTSPGDKEATRSTGGGPEDTTATSISSGHKEETSAIGAGIEGFRTISISSEGTEGTSAPASFPGVATKPSSSFSDKEGTSVTDDQSMTAAKTTRVTSDREITKETTATTSTTTVPLKTSYATENPEDSIVADCVGLIKEVYVTEPTKGRVLSCKNDVDKNTKHPKGKRATGSENSRVRRAAQVIIDASEIEILLEETESQYEKLLDSRGSITVPLEASHATESGGVALHRVKCPGNIKIVLSDVKEEKKKIFARAINIQSKDEAYKVESAANCTAEITLSQKLTEPPEPAGSIMKKHMGLILTVIILIGVCIVVLCTCCICIWWRDRGRRRDKKLIYMEEGNSRNVQTKGVPNPIPDKDIIGDEAPMLERENPEASLNISKQEDNNGWVVPLDELTKAEKGKPEVENTKL